MSTECSICLSPFENPVSIPCGHIFCTKCLTYLANAPDNDSMKASCPTCRSQFNLSLPDLTHLPKKYHQFLVSPVRRVYLDSTRDADFQNRLLALEKNKKLEKRNELLMKQCERHMAHAQAQAEGERKARLKSDELQGKLDDANAALERALAIVAVANSRQRASDRALQSLRDDHNELGERYEKLKAKRNDPLTVDSRLEDLNLETYIRERLSRSTSHQMQPEREIRPLPQRPRVFLKPKARPASPPPIYVNKRPKLVIPRPRDSI